MIWLIILHTMRQHSEQRNLPAKIVVSRLFFGDVIRRDLLCTAGKLQNVVQLSFILGAFSNLRNLLNLISIRDVYILENYNTSTMKQVGIIKHSPIAY